VDGFGQDEGADAACCESLIFYSPNSVHTACLLALGALGSKRTPQERNFGKLDGSIWQTAQTGGLTMPKNLARSIPGRVPLPVGRAGFKPVGGRVGVFGRFDSCLFRFALILQVSASGAKSWVFRFKEAGRLREMGLGPLHTIGLAEARRRAQEHRVARPDGRDPIEARRAERVKGKLDAAKAMTFRACAERYIAAHKPGWHSPKSLNAWEGTLAADVYPILDPLPVLRINSRGGKWGSGGPSSYEDLREVPVNAAVPMLCDPTSSAIIVDEVEAPQPGAMHPLSITPAVARIRVTR
jgi:hypothetical protein